MDLPGVFIETKNDVFRRFTSTPFIPMIMTRNHGDEIMQVLFHCVPERSILSYIHGVNCGLDGTRTIEWVG